MLAQLAGYYSQGDPAFITTWETTTADESITIPLFNGATYDFTVDWGDGSALESVSGSALTGSSHTYASAGTHTVKISGTFPQIFFNSAGDRLKIKSIENWGDIVWLSMGHAFYGCTNLDINATDVPNTAGVSDFTRAWRNCSGLTSFPLIDTSSCTSFLSTWQGCSGLTSFPLIDTSVCVDFSFAWTGCSGLTSFPLIDTSAGINFEAAWYRCSGLTSFPLLDVSSGTNFSTAWFTCSGLTSFPLLGVSDGVDFSLAWYDCANLTELAAGFGLNCGAGTNFSAFQFVTLSTESYSQFLVELEAVNQNNNVPFHGGNSTYNAAGGVARAALINDHAWTITDGGAAP